MTNFKDQVVVVTGGTAGVGFAAAEAFMRAGARTVVLSRDEDRVHRTVEIFRNAGGDAMGLAIDVADREAVERAADHIEATFGPIDVWVNNAMLTVFGEFSGMTPNEFERVTSVTYLGTVWGTQAALKRMLPRNHGTIVQVGSALAYQSIPLQSAYCGAKHAVRGFTNSVRCELAKHKSAVKVTMVQLAAFNTPQFDWARSHLDANPRPLPPVYTPAFAARAILHSIAKPRREYWVGWPTMKTILGARLAPPIAESMAVKQAFDGQKSDETVGPRDGNLFTPVTRAPEAEGRFASESRQTSWQWWYTTHRAVAAVLAAVLVILIVVLVT